MRLIDRLNCIDNHVTVLTRIGLLLAGLSAAWAVQFGLWGIAVRWWQWTRWEWPF